jgi:hypothetical protein
LFAALVKIYPTYFTPQPSTLQPTPYTIAIRLQVLIPSPFAELLYQAAMVGVAFRSVAMSQEAIKAVANALAERAKEEKMMRRRHLPCSGSDLEAEYLLCSTSQRQLC